MRDHQLEVCGTIRTKVWNFQLSATENPPIIGENAQFAYFLQPKTPFSLKSGCSAIAVPREWVDLLLFGQLNLPWYDFGQLDPSSYNGGRSLLYWVPSCFSNAARGPLQVPAQQQFFAWFCVSDPNTNRGFTVDFDRIREPGNSVPMTIDLYTHSTTDGMSQTLCPRKQKMFVDDMQKAGIFDECNVRIEMTTVNANEFADLQKTDLFELLQVEVVEACDNRKYLAFSDTVKEEDVAHLVLRDVVKDNRDQAPRFTLLLSNDSTQFLQAEHVGENIAITGAHSVMQFSAIRKLWNQSLRNRDCSNALVVLTLGSTRAALHDAQGSSEQKSEIQSPKMTNFVRYIKGEKAKYSSLGSASRGQLKSGPPSRAFPQLSYHHLFMIDVSASMINDFSTLHAAVERAINENMRQEDRITIVLFGHTYKF